MKAYILILTITTSEPNLVTQEFNSSVSCEAAGALAAEKFHTILGNVRYVCVEK